MIVDRSLKIGAVVALLMIVAGCSAAGSPKDSNSDASATTSATPRATNSSGGDASGQANFRGDPVPTLSNTDIDLIYKNARDAGNPLADLCSQVGFDRAVVALIGYGQLSVDKSGDSPVSCWYNSTPAYVQIEMDQEDRVTHFDPSHCFEGLAPIDIPGVQACGGTNSLGHVQLLAFNKNNIYASVDWTASNGTKYDADAVAYWEKQLIAIVLSSDKVASLIGFRLG